MPQCSPSEETFAANAKAEGETKSKHGQAVDFNQTESDLSFHLRFWTPWNATKGS